MVHADPTQLQQVLTNLALNARDAMPDGGELRFGLSRFTVHAGAEAPVAGMPPGDWILLSVSDTGTGMTPEVLQHAFEPFFTTKERDKGTGLGLAQVYGLIKQHDGFIDVTSTVGCGTTFTLYLPAAASPQDAAEFETSPTLTTGAGQTVLLVEDEAAVRAVVAWQLEGMGYRVLTASSGEEAWQVFRQHGDTVALVVLDLVMPGMGGAALYRLLRQANPELPVIVLSGYPPGAAVAGLSSRRDGGVAAKARRLRGVGRRRAASVGERPLISSFFECIAPCVLTPPASRGTPKFPSLRRRGEGRLFRNEHDVTRGHVRRNAPWCILDTNCGSAAPRSAR